MKKFNKNMHIANPTMNGCSVFNIILLLKCNEAIAKPIATNKINISIILTPIVYKIYLDSIYTFSPKVSGLSGSNCSLAHITVTKFSVSDKLIIICWMI